MSRELTLKEDNRRNWILDSGRPIAAVALTHVRAYVFPLYTPAGVDVLEECPPDHSHHQGLLVGQDFVNGHNFWAPLFHGQRGTAPLNTQRLEVGQKLVAQPDGNGITISLALQWMTVGGQAVLDEHRTLRFEVWNGFTFVEVTTRWKASYGDIVIGQTKEGGAGMRVHPMLQSAWGGEARNSAGKVGVDNTHDALADWVEISGKVSGRQVGIVMMLHPSLERLPWFTRGYGLHLYTPYRDKAGRIPFGETREIRLAFAAFDGASDGARGREAWDIYRGRK